MSDIRKALAEHLMFFKGWAVYLPFLILILCNFTDQYFITFQGGVATKSYTLSMPVYWVLVSIGTGISAIMAILLKQHIDAGDTDAMNRSASNAIVYTIIFSLIISLIVYLILLPILYSFTEDAVADTAFDFINPILVFNFAITVNMVLMAILLTIGERKKYLFCLGLTLFAELAVDPIFIFIFDMGVYGNGLGTVTSLSISGLLALYWLLRGKTTLRISWRLVSLKPEDLLRAAKGVFVYAVPIASQHIGELVVRLKLYLTYSLTYGIPMLYSSFVAIIGSGTAASTGMEYKRLYEENDIDGAYSVFKTAMLEAFILMMIISTFMYVFAEELIWFFVNHSSLEESSYVGVWTLNVLCFSGPFLGLKIACGAVYADRVGLKRNYLDILLIVIVRTIILVYALEYDFTMAMYLILAERMVIGILAVLQARMYILSKKKRVGPVTASSS